MRTLRAERRMVSDHDDSSRWIVSYADFITLLFAFFVVMYSISSVNDGKFRVLSNSLVSEFSSELSHRPVPIDLGGSPASVQVADPERSLADGLDEDTVADDNVEPFNLDDNATLGERVQQLMAQLIEDSDVVVRDGKLWLEVELPSKLLFESGRSDLSSQALPILNRVAQAIGNIETPIRVEGFTDNVPMRTDRFGSNWQLSAARAAAVVDHFSAGGIDPTLLSAIGFGEFHPIADNDTPLGQSKNRRVVVAIAKHSSVGSGGPVAEIEWRNDALSTPSLLRVTQLPNAMGIL